ncbi:GH25 family lysozyme [Rhizobium sp. AP16]|uniref:glycoside hydrolase family 25 protein n=1 Tax=Rhizobium sp. AP16 TaxID=1144306 RepID=UPI000587BA59|nr:GH25 family lysozyme [Rhizobium sp. AP16]
MRISAVSAILLASLALSGCSTSSGAGDLAAGLPSAETTNSIARSDGPVPSVSVGEVIAQAEQQQGLYAPSAPGPRPQAFLSVAKTEGTPLPAERPVALLMPANPRISSIAPLARSPIYARRFRDAKPINFGVSSPRKLAVHGVDVSRWQGDIDWQTLQTQGANFVYIKATDGGDHLDPMFRQNWRKAKEAGLKRGAYHFFYWCRTAGEQADWFIRNVPKEAGALPPVIDVEWNGESSCKQRVSRERVLEKMQTFMDKLERYYGQRPIIYTAPDFYRDNLRDAFLEHPFWLRAVAEHPSKVYPGRKWLFWQYSGSGLSHGVEGRIDLNAFHGSEDEWHKWVATN